MKGFLLIILSAFAFFLKKIWYCSCKKSQHWNSLSSYDYHHNSPHILFFLSVGVGQRSPSAGYDNGALCLSETIPEESPSAPKSAESAARCLRGWPGALPPLGVGGGERRVPTLPMPGTCRNGRAAHTKEGLPQYNNMNRHPRGQITSKWWERG